MPFGAMRHGFTYVAAGGAAPTGDLWTTTTAINADYQDYTSNKVDYVGDDSSGRPVFLYGYRDNVTNYPHTNLFRRESNGDITFGTAVQLHNGGAYTQAVSGLDTNGNLVGFSSFTVGSGAYCKAYTIDINNLTLGTPGAFRDIYGGGLTAGFAYALYLGNGRFAAGGRTGGISMRMVPVTGTSIGSIIATVTLPFGDGVWQHTRPMEYQSDNYYRYIGSNGNDGSVGAAHYYNTSPGGTVTTDLSTLGLGLRYTGRLNKTNRGVMLSNVGGVIELSPYQVTWPTGGSTVAPSITPGSNITLAESGTNVGLFDGIDDSLIVVYKNSGVYKRVTISATGTTLSQSSPVTLQGVDPGVYGPLWGKYVNTAQGNLLMLITDTGSGVDGSTLYAEII